MAASEISHRAFAGNMSKVAKSKVSNEKKNLSRLAGEFLVASRLTQRGYMVALQWGTTIGYDILVFDKHHNVAYVEVKARPPTLGSGSSRKSTPHLPKTPFPLIGALYAAWI